MSVTFENPWWLWLLALVVPAVWVISKQLHTLARVRAMSAAMLRITLLALLLAALSGAASVRTSNDFATIVLIDVSDSVRRYAWAFGQDDSALRTGGWETQLQLFLEQADRARGTDDFLGLAVFDGEPIALATPSTLPVSQQALDHRSAQGTDLASALRFTRALFPEGARRRIVLISDGNHTTGAWGNGTQHNDVLQQAALSAAAGVPIDVIPLPYRVRGEVMVSAVDTPPQAARNSPVAVRVVLTATEPAQGTLDLLYEDEAVDLNGEAAGNSLRVTLEQGENVFRLPVQLEDRTVHRFEPVFTPAGSTADAVSANNRAQAFTVTPGPGRVLFVDGDLDAAVGVVSASERPLVSALRSRSIETEVVSPETMPSDMLGYQGYDLVVLANVPADRVPDPSGEQLVQYVKDLGGGLIALGGEQALGAGGWNNTALEDVLPIELDLPEEIIVPQAAIAIVLDSSGSMNRNVLGGSRTQMEIATEAAALAVETLDKRDLVTVIAFNNTTRVVVPMDANTNAGRAAAQIRGINAQGGTNLYPAMQTALNALENAQANVKHMIVLSDGQSQGHPDDGYDIARRAQEAGISVSTIGVGDDADEMTLKTIAELGSGEYYAVYNPEVLPRIFVREVRVVRKPMIREGLFTPVITDASSPAVGAVQGQTPDLLGLVLTQAKNDPKITLAMRTDDGAPVLAHWNVGRGRVAAFTSDADQWAQRWLDWPGYTAFWAALVRTTARPATETNAELTTTFDGSDLVIRYDAYDDAGEPMDLLSVPTSVYTPSGERLEVQLQQDAPGSYTGRVRSTEAGSSIVVVRPSSGLRALPSSVGGVSRPMDAELRMLTSNVELMADIAQASGGRVLGLDGAGAASLFDRGDIPPRRASSPLWRVILPWALLALMLDIATRRVAWDRLITRDVAARVKDRVKKSERSAQGARDLLTNLRSSSDEQSVDEPPADRARTATGSNARIEPDSAAAQMPQTPIEDQDSSWASVERSKALQADRQRDNAPPSQDDALREAKEQERQAELRKRAIEKLTGASPSAPAARATSHEDGTKGDGAQNLGEESAASRLAARKRRDKQGE